MLNEHYHTISFKCFGKNGHRQKGIDIFSAEKQMIVQCKHKDLSRNTVLIKKDLLSDIDATLLALKERSTPITYNQLIIATTASEHPDYDEFIAALKDSYGLSYDINFWGWETIQQRLSHLPGTLCKYYPQFKIGQHQESQLLSKITMKKRLERDFADWLNYDPENRRFRSKMIIHSSADTHYPEHPNPNGPWFWFGAEIARLNTKGLGFINELADIYVNTRGQWTIERPEDLSGFKVVRVAKISVVAFEDILDYDLNGDEFYNCPHFYLRFNENHTPFSDFYYQKLDNDVIGIPLYYDSTSRLE
ncbi:hypothetical protein [Pedobacter sp. MR22-3]|uniref:hypothetical protein n=1 Tax=Pedobacter sp. MR22-3 TaxID=2994552 RepID=UPI00224840E2|nr:hypothetical protein [Pedobacter sp. MR22-3]MCX2584344.1 hypothetical protein [Pedobacter sp. MR22-3]